MSSHYRKQLEDWLKDLDVRADRVLDVGGAQLPVMGRTRSWSAERYDILDLPNPHQAKAIEFHKADINVPLTMHNESEPYDLVFCLEVMEYIWNPVVALANLAALTAPGGTLYITFPYFYPPHEPIDDDCLRYTKRGAIKILDICGFAVEEVVPRHAMGAGLKLCADTNMLRTSQRAEPDEVYSLGFIIKAKKL